MAASGCECCGAEECLWLPTPRRRKAGVSVTRVPGGPPNLLLTWSPFLIDWESARSSPLRRPRPTASLPLSAARFAPVQPTPPTGGPRSSTRPSVLHAAHGERARPPVFQSAL